MNRIFPLILSTVISTVAFANPFETILSNGLRVIVKENHRAPTAVQMLWYRAGGMDEVSGSTGLAHVLEHMMFKGTPKFGAGEFSQRVAKAGGNDNAFTSRDYTAYFQQIPVESLEDMMRLESDRMRHLTLDDKEFTQEVKVVMEERRMRTDDEPRGALFEQMSAAALQAHPYRVPVIGWMNDLEKLTVAEARAWYERWYVPNNATLIIAGDVRHDTVFKLAQQYYGDIPQKAFAPSKPTEEPAQKGIRRITYKAPADLPQILMAYKVPLLKDIEQDSDPYALEMLAALLDGHDGARLSKQLIRAQSLAVSVGAGYDFTARGPGFFYLLASPSSGKTSADLEKALRQEIVKIIQKGVLPEELSRAKARLLASQIYQRDSLFSEVLEIGKMVSIGLPYDQDKRILEKLAAVTIADIVRVAKQYFSDDALTIAQLEPQPMKRAK